MLRQYPHMDWDMRAMDQLKLVIPHLQLEDEQRTVVNDVIESYSQQVVPRYAELRAGLIHSDINDANVVLSSAAADTVSGIIDFSDCTYNYVVFELAICMASFSTGLAEPAKSLSALVQGYISVCPLDPVEQDVLYHCVIARLAMAFVLCSDQHRKDPTNDYLLADIQPTFKALELLWRAGKRLSDEFWFSNE